MTRSLVVTLTDEQLDQGRALAARRRARNASAGHVHRWNAARGADFDEVGTLAELAVACAFGIEWPTPGDYQARGGDVGGIEVRATTRMNGRLILHPDDAPDRPYVLVLADSPVFVLAGFYLPGDGLPDDWWAEYRPGGGAYYVPRTRLRAMHELRELVAHG